MLGNDILSGDVCFSIDIMVQQNLMTLSAAVISSLIRLDDVTMVSQLPNLFAAVV